MNELFTPLRIGAIAMANRSVRSATGEGAAEKDVGCPTDAMARFYERLARGGVGLVISGHTAVTREGRCGNRMTAFYDDAFLPAFRRLVDACHRGGAPIVCQLNHGGRQVNADQPHIRSVGPSKAIFEGAAKRPDHALSSGEIEGIVAAFAAAARRCRESGFDGVQLHSAHGYLISQFNSPLTNRRRDRWGGTARKRGAFLEAVFDAVRGAVGPNTPILVKQNVSDFHPDGMQLEEAVARCRMLEARGVAAIELSGGIGETIPLAFRAAALRERGELVFFEEECRRIRQEVRCPLILTGGIRSPGTARRLLGECLCDAVGLCRPLIREPDLPARWRGGCTLPARCVSCGRCLSSPERANECALEARREDEAGREAS
ncbi:MAG: NADH:flavin oxidoreductase [Lentisphaeria bacterium]|nr:NADH:flavin oxidoreductase [Lentisphaeria bacterium]